MPVQFSKTFVAAFAVAALSGAGAALAAASHDSGQDAGEAAAHGHSDALPFGEVGLAAEADRTIEIAMKDNYFEPEALEIRAGETVRFVIRNGGEFLHEFNIGTSDLHRAHQNEMKAMMESGIMTATGMNPDMPNMAHSAMDMSGHAHDDPNSVLVEPGTTRELVWKFAAATDLKFACNVPGHYESGMMGDIRFVKPAQADS
ncbi:MAG: cupredoxin domain-containing protein [Kiloniellaceae bacterium]